MGFFGLCQAEEMNYVHARWIVPALLLPLLGITARAQTSTTEFLPEVDAYVQLSSSVRFAFQDKETIANGILSVSDFGASIEAYLRPLEALQRVTVFDLDETKCVPVLFSVGYRYLPAPDKPAVNRMEPFVMFHFPLKGFLITDKNRADLDWSTGSFKWRYRNRLTAERRLTIHSYHPGPYASAEAFYESPYSKWAVTRLYAGCLLPLSKHVELDPYYQHENNTGPRPNQQKNGAGLILWLFFPRDNK
jgi:Protein of unknown function (DUF2490)